MARDLKAEQKFIEDMSDSIPATGDWKAARVIHRIVVRDFYFFRMPKRTFHSILSVIRRHRAKQRQQAYKYAGKFNKLGSQKFDVWYIKDGVVINENINSGLNCPSTSVPTASIFKSMVDCGELVPA